MKHLTIKWVPETVAIVSLTIAVSPEIESPCEQATSPGMELARTPRTKLIVISGTKELRANVTTSSRLAA
jgi:hypothetical protein